MNFSAVALSIIEVTKCTLYNVRIKSFAGFIANVYLLMFDAFNDKCMYVDLER